MRDALRSRREDRLTRLAARQHGVVSLAQAEALGFTRSDVFRRVRAGRLDRVLPRTLRVAGAPGSLEQRAMAATLWAGPDAVASHETAAALWRIAAPGPGAHVSMPRKCGAAPPGTTVHVSAVPRRDRGRLRGVPVTGVARTLLDLAAQWPDEHVVRAVEESVLGGLVSAEQVDGVVRRNQGRRGCSRLARSLRTAGTSVLERRVDALLRGSGLPLHVREHAVEAFRLDFAWPRSRVAVEADGRRWHSSTADFERDRSKSNVLTAKGWRVLRVTWRDLDEPGPLVATLRELLGS